MELQLSSARKLLALPVQLIETEGGVVLKRGVTEMKITGDRAINVVQRIMVAASEDGATVDEIAGFFAAPDRASVTALVEQLQARRLLVDRDDGYEDDPGVESSLELFYWNFGARAETVTENLDQLSIAIVGVNSISRQLVASLSAAGMSNLVVVDYPLLRNLRWFRDGQVDAAYWPGDVREPVAYRAWADDLDPRSLNCVVATSDFGGQHLLREWNRFCVDNRLQFLPVVLQDLVGYVGPLVVPGETACLECLRARQNSNVEDPATARISDAEAFKSQVVVGFHPAMASILGDIAAIELTKFYSGVLPPAKAGTLIEVNLLRTEMTPRKVLKIPRCKVCGPIATRAPATPNRSVYLAIN